MKRCPDCRRDYYDDTLAFCLEDGTALLQGSVPSPDEPQTAILHETAPPAEAATRAQILTTERTAVLPSGTADVPKKKFDRRLLMAPIAMAVIVAGGLLGYRYVSQANQIGSIAVMPFVNESGNQDLEYLSDGMTETLIKSLSQLPNLSVKARSSVFRYKGKESEAKTIGKELNVQAILTGRIVKRGQDLTLYVELVDAGTENSLWKDSYNKTFTDIVALQNEIARDVSHNLKIKLTGADEQNLAKNYTNNDRAYQLYLEGRFHVNKRTPQDLRKAIGRFDEAIKIDPNYALAFAGLADAYSLLTNYLARSPGDVPTAAHEAMPKAREAALKALSLDPDLAEAHTSLGYVLVQYDYRFADAEHEYRRAIEIDPNYTPAHQWLGELLVSLGRFDEGLAELRRAVEIEPFSLPANFSYGIKLYQARKYPEAITQLNKALELDNRFPGAISVLAWAYESNKNYAEAVSMISRSMELSGQEQRSEEIREVFANQGWEGVLRLRAATPRPDSQEPYFLAGFYAQKGEKDKAFAELEKAYQNRTFLLGSLKVDTRLDPLRDDPRFHELLKKVGFPD